MTTKTRVSNEQVLSAIGDLSANIATLVAAMSGTVAAPVVETPKADNGSVEIDKGYKAHVLKKVQVKADQDKMAYILYARRNQKGETKLAYAKKDKFLSLKDRGLIGAVQEVTPA